jgi:hypothetical protein
MPDRRQAIARRRVPPHVPARLVADLLAVEYMEEGGKRHRSVRSELGRFAETAINACLRAPRDHPA